jgi:N-acetylneuraminic acid mutarotase
MLSAAPLPVQTWFDLVVWNGAELLLPGVQFTNTGDRSVDLAYNPATNRWRRLPDSPYPTQSIEGGRWTVWDGTEILSFGVMNAAFNPSTNVWRPLRQPPVGAPSVVVWTGRQVLAWGGGCCGENSATGAAYDPRSDTWRSIPASPLAGRHTSGVWTGTELIIVGGTGEEVVGNTVQGKIFADAAAYNPDTRSWRRLPPVPAPRMGATVTWTGEEVVVVGGERAWNAVSYADGYAYDPATNRWRHLPAMATGRTDHVAIWTGSHLLVWGGQTRARVAGQYTTPPHGYAYDPLTNRWSALPKSPLRGRAEAFAVWTGLEMIIWGGRAVTPPDIQFTNGAAYRPYPPQGAR